jgi:hypothetical protein
LEEKKIDQATDLAQVDVNKIEAASSSDICQWLASGRGLGWGNWSWLTSFAAGPLMQWLWAFGQGYDIIPKGFKSSTRP